MRPRNLNGFNIIELMVVMVILGVVAGVAVPVYRKYVANAKKAEAYELMGTFKKNEITYYQEHSIFVSVPLNPPAGTHEWAELEEWSQLQGLTPVGSIAYFRYAAAAAIGPAPDFKPRATGDGLSFIGGSWNGAQDNCLDNYSGPGGFDGQVPTYDNFGLMSVDQEGAQKDWVVLGAQGNSISDICTYVLMYLWVDSNGGDVKASGLIDFDRDFSEDTYQFGS